MRPSPTGPEQMDLVEDIAEVVLLGSTRSDGDGSTGADMQYSCQMLRDLDLRLV